MKAVNNLVIWSVFHINSGQTEMNRRQFFFYEQQIKSRPGASSYIERRFLDPRRVTRFQKKIESHGLLDAVNAFGFSNLKRSIRPWPRESI